MARSITESTFVTKNALIPSQFSQHDGHGTNVAHQATRTSSGVTELRVMDKAQMRVWIVVVLLERG
jgi:hypothetical protein